MSDTKQVRAEITDYCKAMLGDGMIDVELDPIHYDTAINRALLKYRQRSSNSVEESYKSYVKKFPIRHLPNSLEEKQLEEVCKKMCEEFRTHHNDGKYED